jgi:hypothetical protein
MTMNVSPALNEMKETSNNDNDDVLHDDDSWRLEPLYSSVDPDDWRAECARVSDQLVKGK